MQRPIWLKRRLLVGILIAASVVGLALPVLASAASRYHRASPTIPCTQPHEAQQLVYPTRTPRDQTHLTLDLPTPALFFSRLANLAGEGRVPGR